jgi:hypothetical protein
MANALNESALEFVRNFGRYQDQAIQSKVVVVTSYNRAVDGYLSAEELIHYERLKARERQVFRWASSIMRRSPTSARLNTALSCSDVSGRQSRA